MKLIAILFVFSAAGMLFGFAGTSHWVATWAASPAPQLPDEQMRSAHLALSDQTLREIIHTSIGGSTVRIRLSNAFGKTNVEIGAVHVAARGKASGIEAATDQTVTFNGRPMAEIPANAVVYSDPIKLAVHPDSDLAISLYLPHTAIGGGVHYSAEQTSYIGAGNQVAANSITDPQTITSWVFLAGVDVEARPNAGTVVAFGDSITDGARSTLDANRRWPNELATRLLARKGQKLGVVDAGIGGNRILHDAQSIISFGVNAIARFDRDVLEQPGVKYVVVMEGINDLGHAGSSAPVSETVTADELIAGLQQLILRAHERSIKIYGATLTPFEGTVFPGYFSQEKEVKRKALNEWIRTSKAFDGVIDFEKAVRDPEHPDRVLPAYDSGDHLHPGDAGYKAMADSIDLALFK
jgi:lysophospholipase L1-like esterase